MARKCVGLQQQQQQMEYNNSTLTRSIRHQYFVKINNYIVQIFFSHYCSIQFFHLLLIVSNASILQYNS